MASASLECSAPEVDASVAGALPPSWLAPPPPLPSPASPPPSSVSPPAPPPTTPPVSSTTDSCELLVPGTDPPSTHARILTHAWVSPRWSTTSYQPSTKPSKASNDSTDTSTNAHPTSSSLPTDRDAPSAHRMTRNTRWVSFIRSRCPDTCASVSPNARHAARMRRQYSEVPGANTVWPWSHSTPPLLEPRATGVARSPPAGSSGQRYVT